MQPTPPNEEEYLDTTFENEDFPCEESFECWDGQERRFEITCRLFPDYGFQVEAVEKGKNRLGYVFAAHDANSPYAALGQLRGKINRALSRRHISRRHGHYLPLHETVDGRIESDPGGLPIFVVDGIPLNYEDLFRIILLHEGWQMRLCFADLAEAFRG